MLFSADYDFSLHAGGYITQRFLDALPIGWDDCVIDSRVHMLMPGWYPCIPGWHLDDVPRTRIDGQPDHENPVYKSEHIMAVFGDASLPLMLSGVVELDDVAVGAGIVYRQWHKEIDQRLTDFDDIYNVVKAKENTLYKFDWQSFHCGQQAEKSGWRMFIRASRNTARKRVNELRTQAQVYLVEPFKGW